jgi:hypothetical protein
VVPVALTYPVQFLPAAGGRWSSALAEFADTVEPGQTVQFPSPSLAVVDSSGTFTFGPAYDGAEVVLDWASMMDYDRIGRRFYFAGGRPRTDPDAGKLVWYDVEENKWDSEIGWSGRAVGHFYRSGCVATEARKFFFSSLGQSIDALDLDTGAISEVATPSGSLQPGAGGSTSLGAGSVRTIIWVPTLGDQGSLIWVSINFGMRLFRYDLSSESWSGAGYYDGQAYTDQHLTGHYHPLTDAVIVGSSSVSSNNKLTIFDGTGLIGTANAPCAVTCTGTLASPFVPHPSKRSSINFCHETNKVWEYNWDADTWTDRGARNAGINSAACIAGVYKDVILIAKRLSAGNSQTWVYKPDF